MLQHALNVILNFTLITLELALAVLQYRIVSFVIPLTIAWTVLLDTMKILATAYHVQQIVRVVNKIITVLSALVAITLILASVRNAPKKIVCSVIILIIALTVSKIIIPILGYVSPAFTPVLHVMIQITVIHV